MIMKEVRSFILENALIPKGSLVVSAFSGGADSLLMTLLLKELSGELSFELRLIHVNHHIRGEEADSDACFAEEFAEKEGLLLKVLDVDPIAYSRDHSGVSVEEAARILRFDAIAKEILSWQDERIAAVAVAHHIEDLAETMLFRLIRGTGPAGFGGMRPASRLNTNCGEIRLIRPLLNVKRSAIEDELKNYPYTARADNTNRDVRYSRNRLRMNVLPELSLINERAVEHIALACEKIFESADFVDSQAKKLLQKRGDRLLRSDINDSHPALSKALVMAFLKEKLESVRDVGEAHIKAIIDSARKGLSPGKRTDLPGVCFSVTTYEEVLIRKPTDSLQNEPKGTIEVSFIKGEEALNLARDPRLIPRDRYTKLFDYDRIEGGFFEIRTFKEGDFMVIDSRGNRALLRRIFIDQKVPKEERELIPLLAGKNNVLWAAGVRDSCDARVTKNTKVILKAEYKEEPDTVRDCEAGELRNRHPNGISQI